MNSISQIINKKMDIVDLRCTMEMSYNLCITSFMLFPCCMQFPEQKRVTFNTQNNM